MEIKRLQIQLQGQVQGVGFRPHVYRIAQRLELTGFVENNTNGVLIEVQGKQSPNFLKYLLSELPLLARVDKIEKKSINPDQDEKIFKILSSKQGQNKTIIPPDLAICSDCLTELFNTQNRYYHYPFLNCTQCGPRLTVTHQLPYDRQQTSMRLFSLCQACQQEYEEPSNRRYHAQPTACKSCGPTLSLSINKMADAILQKEIITIKALGGYQLVCDATSDNTIKKLRIRKQREDKPFALMVADIEMAKQIAWIDEYEESLLLSQARPIVLLKAKKRVAEYIAPRLNHFGIMLPSTPLHYLLFDALKQRRPNPILVVTSANLHGEPLITNDQEATLKLSTIADKIITHNRAIVTRVDDSVMRVIEKKPLFIRRARGFVPTSIKLPYVIPSTLALGGHLKNTFCITRDNEAFVSQHIGTLDNKATIDFFEESLLYFKRLLDVKPECIAHDNHPDFFTTRFAKQNDLPCIAIQHHHAHIAAVLAEHHITEPVIGLVLDGYGFGENGEAWGGELFYVEAQDYQRIGHLLPLPQPGGDKASREPWRMAAGVLHLLGKNNSISTYFSKQPMCSLVQQLLQNSTLQKTSSCGRLFDAASALLKVTELSRYEGQAAMNLESLVTIPDVLTEGWQIKNNILSLLPTLEYLLTTDSKTGANLFHGTLIAALTEWILTSADYFGANKIILSGGCFLNKILTQGLITKLQFFGLTPMLPHQLPPNDGGLSLGQAWIGGNFYHVSSHSRQNI